nr:type I glutamate--ammonia ligase [Egibacter rhizosphaerae]
MGSSDEIMGRVQSEGVEFVDFRFCDLPGLMQHFTIPAHALGEDAFSEGLGFDGSSVRGFQEIQESDMVLVADPTTAAIDPFRQHKTLVMNCFVKDPVTGESYTRDPRYVAQKAEQYLTGSGVADTAYFGPEAEFFVFDDIRFDTTPGHSYYYIDSVEAPWNTGKNEEPNLGYKPRHKQGYFPVPPMDHFQDLRSEMTLELERAGVEVELQHHEVGSAGQAEIDIKFDSLLAMADKTMMFKYIVKNVARRNGRSATFLPKPIFEDNGSGMHTHQSLWKNGEPLFFDEAGYAQLSDTARYYIGGLLAHAPSVLAFSNPTTNSYRRLVPGYEAPVNLVYSQRNRSAACRIPLISRSPKAKRIEFRVPDPSCNPYLAFSAMLMAGLDGVKNKIEPPDPVDKDIYDLPRSELENLPAVPESLEQALSALEADHEFLLEGGVFTEDLIETYLEYKYDEEVQQVRLRPHPYEFHLYYDL